jgi:hypothetical protein
MALLSLGRSENAKGSTSILLVPTNNLAVQYFDWISLLAPASDSPTSPTQRGLVDPSVAQLLIRDSSLGDFSKQIDFLSSTPPQLLVATPQRLMDVLSPKPPKPREIRRLNLPRFDPEKARKCAANLRNILIQTRLIALDEADALLSLPPRFATRKQREKFEVHPPPAVALLDLIVEQSKLWRAPPPRLLFLSATAHAPFRDYISRRSGWLEDGIGIDWIDGTAADPAERGEHALSAVPSTVTHYMLEVGRDGQIRNATPPDQNAEAEEEEDGDYDGSPAEAPLAVADVEDRSAAGGVRPPLEQDTTMLTALATVFALEEVSSGLLFVPDGSSLDRIVGAMQELGVPAVRLEDVRDHHRRRVASTDDGEPQPEPIIFVTTPTFSRGIDIPDLTHVFISSLPPDHQAYSHMAGRVGRFGERGVRRTGKVISVLPSATPDASKMKSLLRRLGVRLQRLAAMY